MTHSQGTQQGVLRGPARLVGRLFLFLAAVGICLITVVTPAAAAAQWPDPVTIGRSTSAAIENYLQRQAMASHIPGTAIGIVQGGKPVVLRGFGNAGPDTPFYLASLSKSFTALAVMQLVDQGKVHLDDPVVGYIPWFKVGDASESDRITVRQLLDQTSGISTQAGLTEVSFKPTTTYREAIEGFERYPLKARPGTLFQYSDANYTLAGYVIQQASGQSYEGYVREHILGPLDMTHSFVVTGKLSAPELTKGYTTWFALKVPRTEDLAAPLLPAGGVVSSASDITHYLTAQMQGGVFHGTRIVSEGAVSQMHAALVPIQAGTFPNATAYGLGWAAGSINGNPVQVHGGRLSDFDTEMAILPQQKIGVIVLENQDPQLVGNPDQLYDGVMQGITTGNFPSISQASLYFYVIFDAMALATLVLMAASFARTRRWLVWLRVRTQGRGFWRTALIFIGLDLGIAVLLALAVLYGLGSVVGYVPLTPSLLLFGAPDVAVWIYALTLFFAVRAVVRTVGVLATRHRSLA